MFKLKKKKSPENFVFLIVIISVKFKRDVCKFLKRFANFKHILLFLNISKQTFHISHLRTTQNLKNAIM